MHPAGSFWVHRFVITLSAMSTIFFIHGAEGFPDENWFPWLKTELEKRGHDVVVPQFPATGVHQIADYQKPIQIAKLAIDTRQIEIVYYCR
jgi:hypothetical protein